MGLQIKGLLSVCIFRERTQHVFQRFRSFRPFRRLCLNNWTWLLGIGDRQGQRQQTSSGSKDYPSNSKGGRATFVHSTSPNLFFLSTSPWNSSYPLPNNNGVLSRNKLHNWTLIRKNRLFYSDEKKDVWISEIQYSNMVAISLAMNTNMNDMD